jgi:hypothetical protein
MGEYEPDDSRDVTLSDHQAPGEPPRTGPREGEARAQAVSGAKDESEKVEKRGKPTARDAAGNKQPGYASEEDRAEAEETDNGPEPLGK